MVELCNSFIDVVIRISRQPTMEICEDYLERSGVRRSVCVYRDGIFIGKLRWPDQSKEASVDHSVLESLEELESTNEHE